MTGGGDVPLAHEWYALLLERGPCTAERLAEGSGTTESAAAHALRSLQRGGHVYHIGSWPWTGNKRVWIAVTSRPPSPRLSAIDEILPYVRDGTITQARGASIAGCHVTTIRRRLYEGGPPPRPVRPAPDHLLDLVEAHGIDGTAGRVGVKVDTVKKWLRQQGVTVTSFRRAPQSRHVARLERGRMLRRRFLERRSYADIARLEGVPPWAVSLWYKKHGLDTDRWRARLTGARRLLSSSSVFKRRRAEEEWAALWDEIIEQLGIRRELEVL